MKARPFLVVALFTIVWGESATQWVTASDQTHAVATQKAGAVKTSTDPSVNPHAAAMADFKARVEKYAALHKSSRRAPLRRRKTPTLTRSTRRRPGWPPRYKPHARAPNTATSLLLSCARTFRQLLAPELKGEDGRDAKAVLKDDAPAPGTVPFKVNAKYPENQPKPTMPAKLLLNLPRLPEPLEYRVVGQHLLLLDTAADVIVDYILNAITT